MGRALQLLTDDLSDSCRVSLDLLGRVVGWASTYGERFADPNAGRPAGDVRFPSGDPRRVTATAAIQAMPTAIHHDPENDTLHLGSGVFGPVPKAVWRYDVGGMGVVAKWFGYRKAVPAGRRSSPLDDVHVSSWPSEWTGELNDLLSVLRRLVELEPAQADLLDEIVAGPLVPLGDIAGSATLPGT